MPQYLVVYQRRRGGGPPIAGAPPRPGTVEIAAVPTIFDAADEREACQLASRVEGEAGEYFAIEGRGFYMDPRTHELAGESQAVRDRRRIAERITPAHLLERGPDDRP